MTVKSETKTAGAFTYYKGSDGQWYYKYGDSWYKVEPIKWRALATNVDNSARSTNPDANATQWNGGANQYASDMPTSDKIFLLSEREATKSEYGFEAWDAYKGDGTNAKCERIRVKPGHAMPFLQASP